MTTSLPRTAIDVRLIPPPQRHATIFAAFRSLGVGEAFDIVNDHDPRPLHQQFQAQAPGQFSWEYVESGPTRWQVSIRKLARGHASGNCCGQCGGEA